MKKNLIRIISLIMVFALMFTFGACKDGNNYEQTGNVTTTIPDESTTGSNDLPKNVNPLTGKADLSESAIGARPIAIMVENSPAARPQWGITTPDIVIEGVVEGGITRMMWIYADANKIPAIPKKIPKLTDKIIFSMAQTSIIYFV